MNLSTLLFHEAVKVVSTLSPRLPDSDTPQYVSMKNYSKMAILIQVANTSTVTGSAISLKQATDVDNSLSDEKTLGFTRMWANLDTEDANTDLDLGPKVGDLLTQVTVSSNTFTTLTTDSVSALYIIEIEGSMLDLAHGFDCVRVAVGDGANMTLGILCMLFPVTGAPAPSAIVN